ncbi:MAG: hypothetical protein Q8873_07180 [Bacillota bacterium]|nr:hypothetical protein [Bacillota bacterium]
MKKLLILFIIITALPISALSKEYDKFLYTPEQSIEMVSYLALKDNDYVYNSLRDLTLMGIFREERNFALANYVTNSDSLKMIFRAAGLEHYAYSCGEDLNLRASLGIPETRPFSTYDGFFIAAYEKGFISRYRLNAYLMDKPGFTAGDYAVRQDIVVWLARLFNISPNNNFTQLNKYGQTSLINPSYKPYFAGLFEAGINVSLGGKLNPYKLTTYSDLVTLLTKFYPYLLTSNNITTNTEIVSCIVYGEDNSQLIVFTNGDTISVSPNNTCIVTGENFVDNTYIFTNENCVGQKLTYYTYGDKIIFINTVIARPTFSYTQELSGNLYFYDDLTGSVVLIDGNGAYMQYYLADDAEIILNGEKVSADKLMDCTDLSFTVEISGCNQYSLKKITRIEH